MDLKVKSLLISMPEPIDGKSPYLELKDKFKIQVSFRPFIHLDPVTAKEFRQNKITIPEHTAIILTGRTTIDYLFRLLTEMRLEMPVTMKYFCASEAIALYLQKFITYRKRKVFYPKAKDSEFHEILLKHKNENYFFPRSNVNQNEISGFLKGHKLKYDEAVIYKTASSDLTDLAHVKFDIIAFFSPSDIKSLYDNFPDFKQDNTRIASFGTATGQAVRDAGLRIDIEAPTPQFPSMKMALEEYIKKANK